MAKKTLLKELYPDVKHILKVLDAHEKEYSTHFETVESVVDILLKQISDLQSSMLFTSISVLQC